MENMRKRLIKGRNGNPKRKGWRRDIRTAITKSLK